MPTNTQGTEARHYKSLQTHYLIKKVVFGDEATQLEMGYIPAGSLVLRAYAVVATAFNDGTADVLDIGTAADPDGFASDIDLQTAGVVEDNALATSDDVKITADTQIVCQYDGTANDAAAGEAYAVVEYVVDPYVVS